MALPRSLHDGFGDRVLARALDGCDPREQRAFTMTVVHDDVGEFRFACGQRARLVEEHSVDLAGRLQRTFSFDEHAQLRAATRTDRDRRGRGETKRTRAGDHENGDEALDGLGNTSRGWIDREPNDERHNSDEQHGWDEIASHHVGRSGDGRARTLCLFDRGHDSIDDAEQTTVERLIAGFAEAGYEAKARSPT